MQEIILSEGQLQDHFSQLFRRKQSSEQRQYYAENNKYDRRNYRKNRTYVIRSCQMMDQSISRDQKQKRYPDPDHARTQTDNKRLGIKYL